MAANDGIELQWYLVRVNGTYEPVCGQPPPFQNVTGVMVNGTLVNTTASAIDDPGLLGGGGDLDVIIGIAIGLFSSVAINIGQNIQALGAKEPGADVNPCTSTKWRVGVTIFATGAIGNMVAMAFASATILVPLESSQFFTNVLFSKYVNGQHVTNRQWLGTAIAVLGTTITCIFGPNEARCFTLPMLESFWANPVWIIYAVLMSAASAFGWYAYHRVQLEHQRTARGGWSDRPTDAASEGTAVASNASDPHADKARAADPAESKGAPSGNVVSATAADAASGPDPAAGVTLPALFAVSSALIGGAQMIVHSKALAEVLDMLFRGALPFVDMMSSWFFWVELAITATCGIYWGVQMNAAITLYDPLFVIPLLQASYILFGSIASGIFYREFETLGESGWVPNVAVAWTAFVSGIVLVVVGILLLAPPEAIRACCARGDRAKIGGAFTSLAAAGAPPKEGTPLLEDGNKTSQAHEPLARPLHKSSAMERVRAAKAGPKHAQKRPVTTVQSP